MAGERPLPRLALAVALGLAVVLALLAIGLHEPAPDCLSPEPEITLRGRQPAPYDRRDLPADTDIDARAARWSGTDPYAVVLGAAANLCLAGGSVQGGWPPDTAWEVMHGTSAVIVDGPSVTVQDLRVDGYGDSLRLTRRAENFAVRRLHLTDSRDDCVENDWLHSGVVEDSLLDGCYNAFSARPYGQDGFRRGGSGLWRIERSLVRLQPMPRPYRDRGLVPGTAGFFKWGDQGPRLSLQSNVFRADQPASTVGLTLPPGKLADCADNVLVWLGEGAFPEPLPDCFRVTRDVGVWDAAVARWLADHGR